MRGTLLFITSFLMLCSCGTDGVDPDQDLAEDLENANYCDCKDLVFDQPYNNFYLTEPRNGFTGLCENFYADGKLSLSKNFKKGKVHGLVITYYENGQIHEKKEFDMNFQVGNHFMYNQNGDLMYQWRYERGNLVETIFPKE